MKKSLLLTLPLMAAMLASCGGKGKGANPNIPDPGKAKEEVQVADATNIFTRAAGVTLSSPSLGLKLGVSSDANLKLRLPDATESAKQGKMALGNSEIRANEINATGLDQVGFQNIKLSGGLDFNASAYANVSAETLQLLSMLVPQIPATEAGLNLDLNLKGTSSFYSNGEKAFFEYDQDLVNAIKTIATMSGATDVQVMDAGKYCTPAYPEEPELTNFKFADLVNQYVAPYLSDLPALVTQYAPLIAQACDEFKGLKYSDTEYAIYAKANVFKLASLFIPEEYKFMLDLINDGKNTGSVAAAIVFDTQKGLKSVGIEAKLDAVLTYGQLQMAQMMGVDENEKLLEAHINAAIALDVKSGSDVKVKEVTNPNDYKEVEIPQTAIAPEGFDL